MLYLHIFPISKSFILNFCGTKVSGKTNFQAKLTFQAKLSSRCVFKVIQHGYEIFQTVLSLNYKII